MKIKINKNEIEFNNRKNSLTLTKYLMKIRIISKEYSKSSNLSNTNNNKCILETELNSVLLVSKCKKIKEGASPYKEQTKECLLIEKKIVDKTLDFRIFLK